MFAFYFCNVICNLPLKLIVKCVMPFILVQPVKQVMSQPQQIRVHHRDGPSQQGTTVVKNKIGPQCIHVVQQCMATNCYILPKTNTTKNFLKFRTS